MVQPASALVLVGRTELLERRAVGGQLIGDDNIGGATVLQRLSQEFQGRRLVPARGDEALEHLALLIDGAREVVLHAVDLTNTSSSCQRRWRKACIA